MHATRAALCWHVSSELCETTTWSSASNASEKYLLIDTCILRDKGHTIPYVRGRKHCAIFFFLIVITRPYSPKSIQLLFKALLFVDHTHIFYSIYFWFHSFITYAKKSSASLNKCTHPNGLAYLCDEFRGIRHLNRLKTERSFSHDLSFRLFLSHQMKI